MAYSEREAIAAVKGSGGFISVIAERLGCTVQTVYNLKDRYPAVREAITEEKVKQVDFAEGRLQHRIAEGSDTAIIFYLKTQAKDRGYVERQEQRHVDEQGRDAPIVIAWPDQKPGESTD